MNPTGCIQHNVIALFVPLLTRAAGLPPALCALAALLAALTIFTRECRQRRRDFPGLTWTQAAALNWTGPRPPHYRSEMDAGRSAWDWRTQGYIPFASATIGTLVVALG